MFSLGKEQNKIPNTNNKGNNNTTDSPTGKEQSNGLNTPPSISLPKGGGAIKGIGEKFAANPVTGTGSLNVPIFTSPGRSGFGPQLSLSYDSGSGNGPFGFGWSLSLPSITRKTDKGLPKYQDNVDDELEEDVFILSGAEDLVPVFRKDQNGEWMHDEEGNYILEEEERDGYDVRQYRPRIEGLFARIERWTHRATGDVHWRSISKDNILTVYGKDDHSRIADPAIEDDNDGESLQQRRRRIFSWLICQSYDDKGNAIVYEYSTENNKGLDLTQANERNRVRTANRYIKRVLYGNRKPLLLDITKPSFRKSHIELTEEDFSSADWMFEVVFDYGEDHYRMLPLDSSRSEDEQHQRVEASSSVPLSEARTWSSRPDPFSTYRAGFEVRTYRRCQRVLMFHRFPELGSGSYLVRSTEFDYSDFDYSQQQQSSDITLIKNELEHEGSTRFASFIHAVVQSGYVRDEARPVNVLNGVKYVTYLKKSLPPLEFEYSKATVNEEIREIDGTSLENLPYGLDNTNYQFVDLDGESISGILTQQAGALFYKPNLGEGKFGPVQEVAAKPSLADLNSGSQQLLDLAGDGQLDIVQLDGPVAGFYERYNEDDKKNWENFVPFASLPNIPWKDPSLRFVDLTGDGHADVLITEDSAFSWYPSMAEEGFGSAQKVHQALEEEKGPRLVFDDGTQSIYLADMSGDGLTDLVRIRNGEVCYWPNLGYGRFGAKVTMDNAPLFDAYDLFDQKRIRLADVDGTGVTDIIYLGGRGNGVQIYFNQSGNRWSDAYTISNFPPVDNLSTIQAVDLLASGTTCLVWSSTLPSNYRRQMRYIDLMGVQQEDDKEKEGRKEKEQGLIRLRQKPHLLIGSRNNLGAETKVYYAPSTEFYLDDKEKGKPWITRLPFPVHVVERVETYDYISRNRFVTHYAYHHGYFDGEEREFRGFGMVEQWDTEEFAVLSDRQEFFPLPPTNIEEYSYVPPVYTKTWFHTGIYLGRDHVSNFFAGQLNAHDRGEYYREPAWQDDDEEAKKHLLDDTLLPPGLTIEEEREACRALKGSMLRQEVYASDGTDKAQHPYTVIEQNFVVRMLQPLGNNKKNRHAVFFTHSKEAITYHYERNPTDPRVSHALTLEADEYGNVLKQVAIGYGRREPDPDLPLKEDRDKQTQHLLIYTENRVTNAIQLQDAYRTPLPCEARTYELTGYTPTGPVGRFQDADFVQPNPNGSTILNHVFEINYEEEPQPASAKQRRLIEQVRTLYRKNDLTDLLALSTLESLALPGEGYKLAFTPGLLAKVYRREQTWQQPPQNLIPDAASVLGSKDPDGGGYVDLDGNGNWWIPSGRVFYWQETLEDPQQELKFACKHFFLPHCFQDPFGKNTVIAYDSNEVDSQRNHNFLLIETRDSLGNRVTVGERKPDGQIDPIKLGNDYRVLQPQLVTDSNRNRTAVLFDALGMVAGTAVKSKVDSVGDTLKEFEPDMTQAQVDRFYDVSDPHEPALSLLKGASSRIIYDLHRFHRTQEANPEDPTQWLPVYVATLARETHVSDLPQQPPDGLKIQISFSYSDGLGREIQKKIQAEPGPLVEGGPIVSLRWVGSGWIVFNNKSKPVRQYEPFFSQLSEKRHRFEFAMQAGVSPILFYDPVERVVATLHSNHTYGKLVFNSWKQISYDVNDTVAAHGTQTGDPRTDIDIHGYLAKYFADIDGSTTWQTWLEQRQSGAMGAEEQAAADKAAVHADTPTTTYFDSLGRPFLTMVHNRFARDDGGASTLVDESYSTRVELDIEGNEREIHDAAVQNGDAQGRIVMRYDYDMLGNRIYQLSIDAGARWMLNDVTGKPIRAWDSRGHSFRVEYDLLRRPLRSFVTGADPTNPNKELLTERMIYGEQHPEDEQRNLRGKLYLHLDQAGMVTTESYDFKGNPLRALRVLAKQYRNLIDWRAVDDDQVALRINAAAKLSLVELKAALVPLLEEQDDNTFTSHTSYDALNRLTQIIFPHSNKEGTTVNMSQMVYNEANLLERVDTWLDLDAEPEGLLDPNTATQHFVKNIDYNAKGQRKIIEYGNGVSTFYEYNPLTFRLVHLLTVRNALAFQDDCPKTPQAGWPGCQVQNLHYTYDPVGNITHIRDDAQQTIFFRNRRVEPKLEYTYDAIYRLVEATGREHLGQVGGAPVPHSYNDVPRIGLFHPNNGGAMGTYKESYLYDAVGNLLEMHHSGSEPSHPGWTRHYAYAETSLIEDGTSGTLVKVSNRLSSTLVDGNHPSLETYVYDNHGNMTHMPQLELMEWEYKDQLHMTQRQKVNDEDEDGIKRQGERTYYVYDAAGQRIRKVTELPGGKLKAERIYLGQFEVYRQHSGASGGLVRETLQIMDDKQRIALVETRNDVDDGTLEQLIRYQFSNHLGSASLELSEQSQIISYEEYFPYGSTAYQAVRSQTEVSLKRYCYTGKERDEETGLYYHGARYYSPWLGRWTSCDPVESRDATNRYDYVTGNPVRRFDPTGAWGVEMHFAAVYWAGRMSGASHAKALFAAVMSQSLDDFGDLPSAIIGSTRTQSLSSDTNAPMLKLHASHKILERSMVIQNQRASVGNVPSSTDRLMREGNTPHALNAPNRDIAELVAKRGIQTKNLMTFGLGLHTSGDFLPHANLTDKATFGHQNGINEDLSESSGFSPSADKTYKNPQKALSTFIRFTELWAEFEGNQTHTLSQQELRLLSKFIFARDWNEMSVALKEGLKSSGASEKEIASVFEFMTNVDLRRSYFFAARRSDLGGEGLAEAYEIWMHMPNDKLLNDKKVDIEPYLKNLPKMPIDDRFLLERAKNK